MRFLSAADHRCMPWKNGGGVTTEIAVFPPGAGLNDFAWRISMARVEVDGPFSLFPGVDRTLVLLDGKALVLSVAGNGVHRLSRPYDIVAFPADVAASARLGAGPVTDLNVMTRRGVCEAEVRLLTVSGEQRLDPVDAVTAVLAEGNGLRAGSDGRVFALGRRDALLFSPGEAAVLTAAEPCPAVVIAIRPVDPR
ncbi:MAG TPA: HutD family protein [Rhizobiales bacterium]|nr:HutD family protein [Hyphomicrobiales bacterium]